MKRCAFAGILLAALFVSGVAEAGDRAVYKAPPPISDAAAPGVFYAGLSLGGRWSDTDWTTTAIGSPPSPPNFGPANPASFDSSTVRIGGYVGYMWRIAPTWVVGIEGDIARGDASKSVAAIPGTCSRIGCGDIAGVKETWDGSIRGRFGFLLTPSWLLYTTGGVAWQELGIDASCSGPKAAFCSTAHSETASSTEAGWTLGAGLEVMLRRSWLVRLEYRFADYRHLDHRFFAGPPGDRVVMNESLKTQTLLLGFAYKLGPGASVVAKH
jgi:outer membrane immunogenic protein